MTRLSLLHVMLLITVQRLVDSFQGVPVHKTHQTSFQLHRQLVVLQSSVLERNDIVKDRSNNTNSANSVGMKQSKNDEYTQENDEKTMSNVSKLPPILQQMADERAVYRMNLGRAMDVLRTDMADILTKTLDYSIYHDEIQAIDPSGVKLTGIQNYKSAATFFQTFVQFWFSTAQSKIQYRMVYDFARSSIRISWNMVLVPKLPLLPLSWKPVYVDGISHYTLDRSSGKITEHKIENLLINNTPVVPPFSILNIIQQDIFRLRPGQQPQAVPGGAFSLSP